MATLESWLNPLEQLAARLKANPQDQAASRLLLWGQAALSSGGVKENVGALLLPALTALLHFRYDPLSASKMVRQYWWALWLLYYRGFVSRFSLVFGGLKRLRLCTATLMLSFSCRPCTVYCELPIGWAPCCRTCRPKSRSCSRTSHLCWYARLSGVYDVCDVELVPTSLLSTLVWDAIAPMLSRVHDLDNEMLCSTLHADDVQVVSRHFSIQEQQPKPGITERVLSIPGAKEMLITISASTFQSNQNYAQGQGASIALCRTLGLQDQIEGMFFTSAPEEPIRVSGDSCVVVYNSGYAPNPVPFSVSAKAAVEEVKVELPWMLDVARLTALLSGKLCTTLVRAAEPPKDALAEQLMRKWLDGELLEQGIQYDDAADEREKRALKWLPQLTSVEGDQSMDDASGTKAPELARTQSQSALLTERQLLALVDQLVEKLQAMPSAKPENFPVSVDVQPIVEEAVTAVTAVLIKHNMLVSELQRVINDDLTPTENLIRVWKTAHKLKRWLVQKSQQQQISVVDLSAEDDEKKAAASAGATPAPKPVVAAADGKENGGTDTNATAGEAVPQSKVVVYSKLCQNVQARCRFLLRVVPCLSVTPARHDVDALPEVPAFTRTKSKTGASTGMTDEQRKARDTLLAWQSTKEAVLLKYASADERFAQLWKVVLTFLSDADVNVAKLEQSIAQRRRKARVKAAGIRAFRVLMQTSALASVKREIAAAVAPSLNRSDRDGTCV